MTEQYLGIKEFADRANERGLVITPNILSVYRERGLLPTPMVLVGTRAGWSIDQVDEWIDEKLNQQK